MIQILLTHVNAFKDEEVKCAAYIISASWLIEISNELIAHKIANTNAIT